ncbi:ferredoxin [Candidatus Epulonipiscioides saccharophilum]|nr:ferredoxin [Epulopiscium sp. SCG-B10WGA-EpuloB]
MNILIATLIVGGTGLFIGIFLGFAGKAFAVEVDPREEGIMGVLPGNNCGGCGYPGCGGLATAIVNGEAEATACPVGGSEVATKIAEIMGQEVGEIKPMTAFVKCGGTCEKAGETYNYNGVEDCKMMSLMQNGGSKACNYGCLGLGTCLKACPFNAIKIIDGVAVIDKELCKACSKCISACPKNLIELIPQDAGQKVLCSSNDKGKDVMSACKVGCIGCKMCTKVCDSNAIAVDNNIAHINYDECTNCGKCATKCPKKCITL